MPVRTTFSARLRMAASGRWQSLEKFRGLAIIQVNDSDVSGQSLHWQLLNHRQCRGRQTIDENFQPRRHRVKLIQAVDKPVRLLFDSLSVHLSVHDD